MKRLNKILMCCVCLGCFAGDLKAEDYCSLIVKVTGASGIEEVRPRLFVVEEHDGRKHGVQAYGVVTLRMDDDGRPDARQR